MIKFVILKTESYSMANKIVSVTYYQTPKDVFWKPNVETIPLPLETMQ